VKRNLEKTIRSVSCLPEGVSLTQYNCCIDDWAYSCKNKYFSFFINLTLLNVSYAVMMFDRILATAVF